MEIARLAERQRGVVTRAQLLAAGLGRHAISHRLASGRLHRVDRGVYAVGHCALAPLALETAAVLRFDGHAVLSHRSAAALWDLTEPSTREVAVTLVGPDARSREGLTIFRVGSLAPVDVRLRHGLPVTAPARTLIDCAADLSASQLERAVAQARVLGLLNAGDLEGALERASRRRGSAVLRAVLAAEGGLAFTRAESERRMLTLVRAADLPAPWVNHRLLGLEVDFCWPLQRLVVEVDGERFHRDARAFQRDRRRDQVLLAAGWRVMRVTWRQLTCEPTAVAVRLGLALGAQAA